MPLRPKVGAAVAPPCCWHLPLPSPDPGSPSPAAQARGSKFLITTEVRVLQTFGLPKQFFIICLCPMPALWRGAGWLGSSSYLHFHTCVCPPLQGLLTSSKHLPSLCLLQWVPACLLPGFGQWAAQSKAHQHRNILLTIHALVFVHQQPRHKAISKPALKIL